MALPDIDDIDEIVVDLEEEDGTTTECQVICMFEYDDKNYAALTPTDETIEELYFFELQIEEGADEFEFTLDNIEDDDILPELAEVFDQIMGDTESEAERIVSAQMDDEDDEDEPYDDDDDVWDKFINKKIDDD